MFSLKRSHSRSFCCTLWGIEPTKSVLVKCVAFLGQLLLVPLRGEKKHLSSHPHKKGSWYPLRILFKILEITPVHLRWESHTSSHGLKYLTFQLGWFPLTRSCPCFFFSATCSNSLLQQFVNQCRLPKPCFT